MRVLTTQMGLVSMAVMAPEERGLLVNKKGSQQRLSAAEQAGRTSFRCREEVLGRCQPDLRITALLAPLDLLVAVRRARHDRRSGRGGQGRVRATCNGEKRRCRARTAEGDAQEKVEAPAARIACDVRAQAAV